MSSRLSFASTTGLIRGTPSPSPAPSSQASSGGTKPGKSKIFKMPHRRTPNDPKHKASKSAVEHFRSLLGNNGIVPLGPLFVVGIGVVISLLFVAVISFAFIGAGEEDEIFKSTLDDLAQNSPGLVLIGDNVDIDVDEPAVTIRWSILACGANFTLPGSEGTHGSSLCGIPNMPLFIYVDSEETPTAIYEPNQLPFTSGTNERLRVQNLHQFDSDNVLNVHEARLYPFDTYRLTSTLRAVASSTNQTMPIMRLLTITDTSSFIVSSSDSASYYTSANDASVQVPSRNIQLDMKRPGEARFFALMLFGVSWMLAHSTVAYVALAWKADDTEKTVKYLVFSVLTMLVIPQIRNAMPDAPGYDGVLIDQIGFFSQMLLTGIAIISLLATLARRELSAVEEREFENAPDFVKEKPAPLSKGLHRLRGGSSTSVDLRHLRNMSLTGPTKRVQMEPPVPMPPRRDHVTFSPFSDANRVGGTGIGSSPLLQPPRLNPSTQRIGGNPPKPAQGRPSPGMFAEWI